MTGEEKLAVSKAVTVTMELCGTAWSEAAVKAVNMRLQQYPAASVLAALSRCQTELNGRLTLAAIVERVEEAQADGWPGPNEAWAAVGDRGEADTMVCVQEAFTALDSALPLMDSDAVAARMAFLESYKRLVAKAKADGRRPEWRASLGHDRAGRQRALLQAVERGWLPRAEAERQLGEPLGPKALPGNGLKLLAGKTQEAPKPQEVAAKLSELLGTFVNPELARQALEERRREWGAKPIVQAPDSGYRPPNREEVAELRRRQGQGS
jgi:hypothetical protein